MVHQIFFPSSEKIINHNHTIASGNQTIHKVAPYESCSTSHDNPQSLPLQPQRNSSHTMMNLTWVMHNLLIQRPRHDLHRLSQSDDRVMNIEEREEKRWWRLQFRATYNGDRLLVLPFVLMTTRNRRRYWDIGLQGICVSVQKNSYSGQTFSRLLFGSPINVMRDRERFDEGGSKL
ncbi:hypothetical protein RJ641_017639 [Dillenia turbinata]|uniref:Uncharacterized protein n=1 Tax=Dillenia turbinata TaxID=194707 RepID=A0AAN8UVY3_9MAGN